MIPDKFIALELGRYGNKVRTQAFRQGVEALGGTVQSCYDPREGSVARKIETGSIRFAFTSGMHWPERKARAMLEKAGIPLVVLDLGYFKRASGPNDATGYNQVGINRIGWAPDAKVDSSRWDALGLPNALLPIWRVGGDLSNERKNTVLVLGQVAMDSQHGLSEKQLTAWFSKQVNPFKSDGKRIVFRPHPLAKSANADFADNISHPDRCSLSDALDSAGAVITYNSTAGLEAILKGIPVECYAMTHYRHIASYGYEGPATYTDVMQHMHRLAWAQWTCDEIASGQCLRSLFNFGL